MKIGIVTLPLLNNYGGIVQNYALQKVLSDLGHESFTFDYRYKSVPLWIYVCSWLKTLLYFFIPGKRRPFAKITPVEKRLFVIENFLKSNVSMSEPILSFSREKKIIDGLDAIIVGSDQIWRPKYAPNIEDSFLGFSERYDMRRISYAASFGVDKWEYSIKLTQKCVSLVKKFNAISVREESGVKLCKKYFGIDATWVLDPTLLLDEFAYLKLCKDVPVERKKFLAAYVLDMDESVLNICKRVALEQNLELKIFSADIRAELSIPEWIALFRDASYVITDSFHGTIFSIIFKKEFKCLYNEKRGLERFKSLLKLHESGKIDEMRDFSINWLRKALEF